jgi:hypothetical protein
MRERAELSRARGMVMFIVRDGEETFFLYFKSGPLNFFLAKCYTSKH